MRQLGYRDDFIHDFLDVEGLPREPTTISAVRRIAEATGATVAEVLALLGVHDINSRRTPVPDGDDQVSAGKVTSANGQADTRSS
jgi:uncharacterized protein with GYD domain